METKIGNYEKNEEALKFILNYIKILCNNQDDVYDSHLLVLEI